MIPVKPGTARIPASHGNAGADWPSGLRSTWRFRSQRPLHPRHRHRQRVLWILDRRRGRRYHPPHIVGGFGSQGHNAGNFTLLHGLAVDSKGNLYTAETVDGRRLQKFIPEGRAAERPRHLLGSPHYEPFPDPTP